jgi:hypothetical protein
VDPDPSDILSNAPVISTDGTTVTQFVTGGLNGNSYMLRAEATLTGADGVLVRKGVLPISNQ